MLSKWTLDGSEIFDVTIIFPERELSGNEEVRVPR